MTCHLYNQIKVLSVYLEAVFFQKDVFFSTILSYRTLEQHEGISFSVVEHCAKGKAWAWSSAHPKASELHPLQFSFISLLGSWH